MSGRPQSILAVGIDCAPPTGDLIQLGLRSPGQRAFLGGPRLSASCSGRLAPTIGAVIAGLDSTQRIASVAMFHARFRGHLAHGVDGFDSWSCQ